MAAFILWSCKCYSPHRWYPLNGLRMCHECVFHFHFFPVLDPLRIALSVLCLIGSMKTIRHFSVQYDKSMGSYFITPSRSFARLQDLIHYYHKGKLIWFSSSSHLSLLPSPIPIPFVLLPKFQRVCVSDSFFSNFSLPVSVIKLQNVYKMQLWE